VAEFTGAANKQGIQMGFMGLAIAGVLGAVAVL
jgi:hypothetical protein